MTFADDVVTELKAKWNQTYITIDLNTIVNGKLSKFKKSVVNYVRVYSGIPGEDGRINDNSAKIETDQATVICSSNVLATAEKFYKMVEHIVEEYTYPQGGGWWQATKLQPKESNDLHLEALVVNKKLFKVREVIS